MGQGATFALSDSDKNLQTITNSYTRLPCLNCICRRIKKAYAACEDLIFAGLITDTPKLRHYIPWSFRGDWTPISRHRGGHEGVL